MAPSLTHIGIAVPNLTASVQFYRSLGFEPHSQTMSLSRVEMPDHPILQLNPRIENVEIVFVPTSGGVGIELFEFGMSDDGAQRAAGEDSDTVTDDELKGIFHLAVTPEESPEQFQQAIVAGGGRKLGSTLRIGAEHTATNGRDPWGTIIEAISCNFEDLIKSLFG